MQKYWILYFVCLLNIHVFSQKQIAEIELSYHGAKNLSGVVCGDSLFLTYYETNPNKLLLANFRALWIYPNGSQKEVEIKELADKLLIGIIHRKDSIQYYFLEESRKKIEIGVLTYHRYSNQKGSHSNPIILPGKLLGSYVDKNLFLVYATKEESAVRILEINNLAVVREEKFSGSFEWDKLKNMRATFIDGRFPMRNSQLITPIRIIKEDSALFVIADEPATTETASQPSFKTYVSKLDVKTNTSSSKVFFEQSRSDFRTVVKDNKVFRFVSRRDPELSVYDFETRSLLSKSIFAKKEKREYYARSGIKNEIKKVELDSWSPLNSLITVDSSPSGYIITLGGYGEQDPNVPFISMFGLLPAAISLVANAAVHELNDGPMGYSYYYLEMTKDGSTNRIITNTGLLKQQVDNYELSLPSKMVYKSYIDTPNAVYAFYLNKSSLKMQVMKFD